MEQYYKTVDHSKYNFFIDLIIINYLFVPRTLKVTYKNTENKNSINYKMRLS